MGMKHASNEAVTQWIGYLWRIIWGHRYALRNEAEGQVLSTLCKCNDPSEMPDLVCTMLLWFVQKKTFKRMIGKTSMLPSLMGIISIQLGSMACSHITKDISLLKQTV